MKRILLVLFVCLGLVACTSNDSDKKDITLVKSKKEKLMPLEGVADYPAKILYKQRVISSFDYSVRALDPVLTNGRAYFADTKGHIRVLDLLTGKTVMKLKNKIRYSSDLGSTDNYFLIGDSKANLTAYNLDTGAIGFTTKLNTELTTAPIYSKAHDLIYARTIDGTMHAIRASDGKRVWVYERDNPALVLRGSGNPVLDVDLVISGYANGKIAALEAENGKAEWEVATTNASGGTDLARMTDIVATPVVWRNSIYAALVNGNLVSIAKYSGRINWKKKINVQDKLAVDSKLLYVVEEYSIVKALDNREGDFYWVQKDLAKRKLKGPVLMGDKVIVADELGFVYVLAKGKGKVLGKINTKLNKPIKNMFVKENTLYLLAYNGYFMAIELSEDI